MDKRDEDDDDIIISLGDPVVLSPRSQANISSLNLVNVPRSDFNELDAPQEEEVTVVFELADGSQKDSKFRRGQTVEYLKFFCEGEFGIPIKDQKLRIQGKIMMDPLSLIDFPETHGNYSIN